MNLKLSAAALTGSILALTAWPALADALSDAQAGMAALTRGDNAEAIRLFTQALNAKAGLKGPDRELAYVKRAEARLAAGQRDLAAADAAKALKLNPEDSEARAVGEKARGAVGGAGRGPSLAETLDFLRGVLEQNGSISHTMTFNSTANGSSVTIVHSFALSEISTTPADCNLAYHQEEKLNGQALSLPDALGVPFREVSEVTLVDAAAEWNLSFAKAGYPDLVAVAANPLVTKLRIVRTNGTENDFLFYDRSLAERFAKAARHAAQLCGGLKRAPF